MNDNWYEDKVSEDLAQRTRDRVHRAIEFEVEDQLMQRRRWLQRSGLALLASSLGALGILRWKKQASDPSRVQNTAQIEPEMMSQMAEYSDLESVEFVDHIEVLEDLELLEQMMDEDLS